MGDRDVRSRLSAGAACRLAGAATGLPVVVLALLSFASSCQAQDTHQQIERAIEQEDYQGARDLLAQEIDEGSIPASTLSGLLCLDHLYPACSAEEAAGLLVPGAENGDAAAQYGLARALLAMTPPRTQEARSWLASSGEAGHAMALFTLGQLQLASRDPAEVADGVARVRDAAERGVPMAQSTLAALYEAGSGVERDPDAAVRWYREAAEQGSIVAQVRLGYLYEHGLGVDEDAQAADHWYRAAAEAGSTEAQYNLGMMYMLGEVTDPDYYEGIYWLERAANAGMARAQDALGRAYVQGLGVRMDLEQAVQWFELAGDQGYQVAQYNAGAIYDSHSYRWWSPSRAAEWYERAASGTDPEIRDLARSRLAGRDGSVADFAASDRELTSRDIFLAIVAVGVIGAITSPNAGLDGDILRGMEENERLFQEWQTDWRQELDRDFDLMIEYMN